MRNNKIPYRFALPLEQSCSTGQPLHSGKGNFMEHYKNLLLENINGERWKDVVGFKDLYLVSNKGRIKSLPRKVRARLGYRLTDEIILTQIKRGLYLKVGLYIGDAVCKQL